MMMFMQSDQEIVDDDDGLVAPKEAVHKSHISDVVDILENLLEKAQAQLDAASKTVADAAHHVASLEQ